MLRGIDWRVEVGERWVILGPNGSGKTTLLQVAAARLWPTAGTVEVLGARLGRSTSEPSVHGSRWSAARSPGSSGPTWRPATSWSAAATGRSRRGGTATRTEDWEKADGLLALGGVGGLGDRPFGVISEGERQQVLLARALMSDPELILLDEPFAGLDLGARERLLVRLTALAADPASPPIVLVTHHCEEIPPGFTQAGLVSGGDAASASGRLPDVVTSERVSACFGVTVTVGCTDGRWWSRAV